MARDDDLRVLLQTLDPSAREHLPTSDDADRDAIVSTLMRYRDQNGQGWADIIDLLAIHPAARRRGARAAGEMEENGEPAPIALHPEALPERLIKQV
jgi:hypothetical protein